MGNKKTWVIVVVIITVFMYLWIKGLEELLHYYDAPAATPVAASDTVSCVFPESGKTRYYMDLSLNSIASQLSGHTVISTVNTCPDDLSELFITTYPNAFRDSRYTPVPASAYQQGFNPGWIKINSVKINGVPVQYEDLGITGKITPGEAIPSGQDLFIEITWEEKIPRAAYRFGNCDTAIMLGNFYPMLNVKDDRGWHLSANYPVGDPFFTQCADYVVRLELPEFYQIAASGSKMRAEALANGRQIVEIGAENARDFAVAALMNYQRFSTEINGIRLIYWFNNESMNPEAVIQEMASIVEYYNKVFGPYPYSELNMVQVPMEGYQGMEHSGLIFMSRQVLANGFSSTRRSNLIAHELAHQWWYGQVGNDQITEPWLDEGLASWAANQYLRKVKGIPVSRPQKTTNNLVQGLSVMKSKEQYMGIAYSSGECFWFELQNRIGDKEVNHILKEYLERYRYKSATTAQLLEIIEENSREDMSKFFELWFDKNTVFYNN